MNKQIHPDSLVEMLQKPPEVFAGIMPLQRALYSGRLYLQRCRKIDAVELCRLLEKNRQYLEKWLQPQPDVMRVESVLALIADDHLLARKGQRLDLGIFSADDDRLIGRIALHSVDYGIQRSAGLSYWVDEDLAGKGLMTEAIATLVSFAFEEACLHRIWLKAIDENVASSALARKLGFKKEGVLRQSLFVNGKWHDSTLFAMLEDDYDQLADSWINHHWLGS